MTAERRRYWRPEMPDFNSMRIARGGVWSAVIVGLSVGLLVIAAQVLLDRMMHETEHILVFSDVFMGVAMGIATGLGLRHYQTHIQADRERMHMVAEMNHHVRNALTAISLSVYAKNDPQLETTTREAIQRIDWALREVLAPQNSAYATTRRPISTEAETASRRSA